MTLEQKTVQRFDAGRLGKAKRTPQGGVRVDAALTSSDVFEYLRADGSVFREWRPPEEVFHEDSKASLEDAPVTHNHPYEEPEGLVTPANAKRLTSGHLSGSVKQDSNKLVGSLVVQDGALMADIDSGRMNEVSLGYRCRMDFSPGVTPDGKPYDAIQRDIRYNHIAIVPKGRAGASVSLRLDAADNQTFAPLGVDGGEKPQEEKAKQMTIKIDGADFTTTADAQVAFVKYEAKTDAKIAALKSESDKNQARADAAEASAKELAAKLAEATDPTKLDAAVKARVELHTQAVKVLGKDVKLDRADSEIKAEIVAKAFPSIKLDGQSADYVEGIFSAAIAKTDAANPNDAILGVLNAPEVEAKADAKDETPAWQKPLAMNKN